MLYFFACLCFTSCKNFSNSGQEATDSLAVTGHEGHHMESSSPSKRKYIDSVNKGLIKNDTLKGSPKMVIMRTISGVHLHMQYSSPGVKGRVIWGGLVPYEKVWVTGAHEATTLEINNPIIIVNQKIEAGKYAIFTIPGKEMWTFILNKNHRQHLADEYSERDDIIRVEVKPISNSLVERLRYSILPLDSNKGKIIVEWEMIKIEVPFDIPNSAV